MTVELIGHQWWFEYRYPEEGIETANVLVIPTGREVCARLTSDDVIHSIWVPQLVRGGIRIGRWGTSHQHQSCDEERQPGNDEPSHHDMDGDS